MNNTQETTSIPGYLNFVYNILRYPQKTFASLDQSYYQLTGYLILSAWLYAIIASFLKSLAPFLLLILSPFSVMIHSFLLGLFIYIIFNKLYKADTSLKECCKISSYIMIALLPFMAIVFTKNKDTLLLLAIKAFPYIYYLVLVYIATSIRFTKIKTKELFQGNVFVSLTSFFISTVIFTINMVILSFLCEILYNHTYVWKMYYS